MNWDISCAASHWILHFHYQIYFLCTYPINFDVTYFAIQVCIFLRNSFVYSHHLIKLVVPCCLKVTGSGYARWENRAWNKPLESRKIQISIKSVSDGAGEMAHWVRAVIALLEDPGSIPATSWQLKTICNSSPRGSMPSSGLHRPCSHTVYKHTCR